MKLTKCEHGHVYDGDKFAVCPYCTGKTDAEILDAVAGEVPAGAAPEGTEQQETGRPTGAEPVQGWLVAVAGPALGRDFRLTEGRNFAGASSEMEIDLSADASVGAEHCASIVYDAQNQSWYVHPCETKQLFYCNEEAVLAPRALAAGDRLKVGGSVLVFVPFGGYGQPEGEEKNAK